MPANGTLRTGRRPSLHIASVAVHVAALAALAIPMVAGSRPPSKKGAGLLQASKVAHEERARVLVAPWGALAAEAPLPRVVAKVPSAEGQRAALMSLADAASTSAVAVLEGGALVALHSQEREAPTESDVVEMRKAIQKSLQQVSSACQVKAGSALQQTGEFSRGMASNDGGDHPGQQAKARLDKCLSEVKVLNQHLVESGTLANDVANAYAEQFTSVREAVHQLADRARTDGALKEDWSTLSQVLNGDISRAEANTQEIKAKGTPTLARATDPHEEGSMLDSSGAAQHEQHTNEK